MELRSTDAVTQINVQYGGVQNLCSRLKTSPVEGKDRGWAGAGARAGTVAGLGPGAGARAGARAGAGPRLGLGLWWVCG